MKSFIQLFVLFIGLMGYTQMTQIPDPDFEQYLIDQNIDSDATVNGQVLTNDLNTVVTLDLSNLISIDDITGIKDFASLKVLNISDTFVDQQLLDLSGLQNLEEFYFSNTKGEDVINVTIETILLTDNPNLKIIEALHSGSLEKIYLTGSDSSLSDLKINLHSYGSGICIYVSNAVAAQNNQGIYSNWDIDICCNYAFADNSTSCSLTTEDVNMLTEINIYPNPVDKSFHLQSNFRFEELFIYNLQGKFIKAYDRQNDYDISDLSTGVYFVKIYVDNHQFYTRKIIKN